MYTPLASFYSPPPLYIRCANEGMVISYAVYVCFTCIFEHMYANVSIHLTVYVIFVHLHCVCVPDIYSLALIFSLSFLFFLCSHFLSISS